MKFMRILFIKRIIYSRIIRPDLGAEIFFTWNGGRFWLGGQLNVLSLGVLNIEYANASASVLLKGWFIAWFKEKGQIQIWMVETIDQKWVKSSILAICPFWFWSHRSFPCTFLLKMHGKINVKSTNFGRRYINIVSELSFIGQKR